jgi:hypothetical protein
MGLANGALCLTTPKHNGKSGTGNICITNDYWYVLFVVITIPSFQHSRLIIRFVTRVTRRVPPEYTPGFEWHSRCSIFCFLCSVLQIIVLSLCSFCFWPLHCLSLFDLRFLVIPLVSSQLLPLNIFYNRVQLEWAKMSFKMLYLTAKRLQLLSIYYLKIIVADAISHKQFKKSITTALCKSMIY